MSERIPSSSSRQTSVVIYGEEDGHAFVTIKTEVTIEIRSPEDVEAALRHVRLSEGHAFPAWRHLSDTPRGLSVDSQG